MLSVHESTSNILQFHQIGSKMVAIFMNDLQPCPSSISQKPR